MFCFPARWHRLAAAWACTDSLIQSGWYFPETPKSFMQTKVKCIFHIYILSFSKVKQMYNNPSSTVLSFFGKPKLNVFLDIYILSFSKANTNVKFNTTTWNTIIECFKGVPNRCRLAQEINMHMNEWMGFSPTLNWLALEEIVRIKKQD